MEKLCGVNGPSLSSFSIRRAAKALQAGNSIEFLWKITATF
jgi:hypothetical protein